MLSFRSKRNLRFVHQRLSELAETVATKYDFVVITGYRDAEEQALAFEKGHSMHEWPRSPHNKLPALAIDFLPANWDGDWTNVHAFATIARAFVAEGHAAGFDVSWDARFPEHLEIDATWASSTLGFSSSDTGRSP